MLTLLFNEKNLVWKSIIICIFFFYSHKHTKTQENILIGKDGEFSHKNWYYSLWLLQYLIGVCNFSCLVTTTYEFPHFCMFKIST